MIPTINEKECTITHAGRSFTSQGAYLDESHGYGMVYLVEREGRLVATTWHGTVISDQVKVTSSWKRYTGHGSHTMKSVRININGAWYAGRYGSDWTQLCRIRRVKS